MSSSRWKGLENARFVLVESARSPVAVYIVIFVTESTCV
jgi:hypothetical protein